MSSWHVDLSSYNSIGPKVQVWSLCSLDILDDDGRLIAWQRSGENFYTSLERSSVLMVRIFINYFHILWMIFSIFLQDYYLPPKSLLSVSQFTNDKLFTHEIFGEISEKFQASETRSHMRQIVSPERTRVSPATLSYSESTHHTYCHSLSWIHPVWPEFPSVREISWIFARILYIFVIFFSIICVSYNVKISWFFCIMNTVQI